MPAAITLVLLVVSLLLGLPAPHPGTLTDNQRITSEALGYDLHYRVYTPEGYEAMTDLPVLYITDGQWYIDSGEVPQVMDQLIAEGKMRPAIAVFVDNRNPDNLNDNRRNRQFFCNPRYSRFFTDELIPHIDATYPTHADRSSRVILGLSFGGLNSACFGLQAADAFEGIAMQSPATHPVPDLHDRYSDGPKRLLNIFLSSGTQRDNEAKTRAFKRILEAKGYPLHYVEVPHGHTWANWKPLIDDVLVYYFGA